LPVPADLRRARPGPRLHARAARFRRPSPGPARPPPARLHARTPADLRRPQLLTRTV